MTRAPPEDLGLPDLASMIIKKLKQKAQKQKFKNEWKTFPPPPKKRAEGTLQEEMLNGDETASQARSVQGEEGSQAGL